MAVMTNLVINGRYTSIKAALKSGNLFDRHNMGFGNRETVTYYKPLHSYPLFVF